MRCAQISRETGETKISLTLNIDGTGRSEIHTGIGFFDHMLTLFAKHGRFDLTLTCDGDLQTDAHHSVEDCGIVLGEAFRQALGDKKGINRYGFFILPMDEALILSSLDLSGRSHLEYRLYIPAEKVGEFDTELTEEFFEAFVRNAQCTLHIDQISGKNSHHIIEGAFKSVARSMKAAVAFESGFEDDIPSTKGVLS